MSNKSDVEVIFNSQLGFYEVRILVRNSYVREFVTGSKLKADAVAEYLRAKAAQSAQKAAS